MKTLHVVGGYPIGTQAFILWQLHDTTGRLFPVGDVTGLVESIRRLAHHVALRTTMGAAVTSRR